MIQPEDIKRLYNYSEKSAEIGNKINSIITKIIKVLLSKTCLIIGAIICTVIFVLFGILNRKNQYAK